MWLKKLANLVIMLFQKLYHVYTRSIYLSLSLLYCFFINTGPVDRVLKYINKLGRKEVKKVELLKDIQIPLQDDRISKQITCHLRTLISHANENQSTKSKLSCFMISGPPGIGKTTEANNIIETIRKADEALLNNWRWHVTVNTCAEALTGNHFAILDSYCAAKYSNWDRSNISAADKKEFQLNSISEVLERCELARVGDEADQHGTGIVFVVLDEAQLVHNDKLQELISNLRGAQPSSQCIYVPIVVGTDMQKLREACVTASGGSQPVEVILGPLSCNGVRSATSFICGLQREPSEPSEVLTNLTCFAGGNPRLLVLLLGICGYSYSGTTLPHDFFELQYHKGSLQEFANACAEHVPDTVNCITNALRCSVKLVGAVFRFQAFNNCLGANPAARESLLRSLVAISLTQLPIPLKMLHTKTETLNLNKLVEIGFFSVKNLDNDTFTLAIPNLVLRHAIDGLKSNLQNLPADMFASTPFKVRSADDNEVDDVAYIIWRLTALRFIHQESPVVSLSEVLPFGVPLIAAGVRIFLPNQEEMQKMYTATQANQARQKWTAKHWQNCTNSTSFVYINYPKTPYADSFFQFRVDEPNSLKSQSSERNKLLVVGIQSKRFYSSTSAVDVEAEHKKFKETESYRPCFQLIITANDNVTMPEELKDSVGLVQQQDFEKFFGEIVARDRNIAQLAYRIIPMTLFC